MYSCRAAPCRARLAAGMRRLALASTASRRQPAAHGSTCSIPPPAQRLRAGRRGRCARRAKPRVAAARSARSPRGRACRTASARAGWNASPMRSKRASKTSPRPNRATAASRCALARDVEIPRAISNLRFFAHAATQFASESHHGQAGLNYTLRQPLGVVGGDLAVEPAAVPVHLEDRAGAGRRQHGGRQAVGSHAADGDDARRTGRGDRLPDRRAQHRARPGPGRRRAAGARIRSVQGDLLHRQHRGRHAHRRRSPRRC